MLGSLYGFSFCAITLVFLYVLIGALHFFLYIQHYLSKKKKGPTKVTYANNKCDMLTTPVYLGPTKKPKRKPQLTVAESYLKPP